MQRALAAVIDEPWADQPRESFAEAVAATDPDRATFVRAQLGIARARRAAGVRRRPIEADALAASLKGLANGARWSGGLEPLLGLSGRWRFRRGFIEEVTLQAHHFLQVASDLAALAPVLDLVLTEVKPVAAQLFASPHLARIRSLDLSVADLGDAEVELLARSPHLRQLRWLSLYFNKVSDAGVEVLAGAGATLPALRFVRLDSNPCSDPNPIQEEEDGRLYGLCHTARAADLRARFGPVGWLGDNPSADSPDPETFQ